MTLFNNAITACTSRLLSMKTMGVSSFGMVFCRTLMKTHRGALKRWRKTSTGFKRGIAGRKHGNIGWSHRSLKSLTGRTDAHPTQMNRLRRLMPYK